MRIGIKSSVAATIPPLLLTLVFVAIWDLSVRVFDIKPFILPSPMSVVEEMWAQRTLLLSATWVTTKEVLVGYALGSIVGYLLGLVIYRSKALESSLYPLLVGSQAIPKIALAPLFIVWFGYELMPKILVTALIVFFPLVITTHRGMKAINSDLVMLMRSAGASKRMIFMKVEFPSALPQVLSGLQIASAFAVVGAIVGELMGATEGLGYIIVIANAQINTPLLMADIAYLVVLGALFYWLLTFASRLVAPWAAHGTMENLLTV